MLFNQFILIQKKEININFQALAVELKLLLLSLVLQATETFFFGGQKTTLNDHLKLRGFGYYRMRQELKTHESYLCA